MRNGSKVFDADAHVVTPRELQPSHLDHRRRDRVGWEQPIAGSEDPETEGYLPAVGEPWRPRP